MKSWIILTLLSFSFSVQALENLDTCFSPDNFCDKKVIQFFRQAQRSADIAVFSFSHQGIRDAILQAQKRGVKIRLIVDRDQAASKSSMVSSLSAAGLEVKFGTQEGSMHHKFAIIDGEWIQLGSFNYTYFAASKSAENQIYLNDANVIKSYQKEFDHIWEKGVSAQAPAAASGF